MTALITMHTHSAFCGHAKDPLSAMVDAAEREGVRAMAATEHYPIPDDFDPTGHSSMPARRLEAVLRRRDRERAGIPAWSFCSAASSIGSAPTRRAIWPQRTSIASTSCSGRFISSTAGSSTAPAKTHRWAEAGVDDVWRRYIELWCDAAASDAPFTAMSHPDVVKKFGFYPSFDMLPHYDRMAEAAREEVE